VQRCIDDWREQAERSLPADTRAWSQGASAGPGTIDVVLFGDYQEEFTAAMDIAIRALVADHPSVRYTFRHYPIDPACNPVLPANVRAEALHPLSCRAARAAEAAGTLGGAQAYWKMHAWLMGHHREFGDAALRSAAPSLGLEADALLSAMERPELGEAIAEDARAAKESGLASLPMVFVNSKWVPHPVRGQENIVLRILQELTDS
jgi:protein-disulfide isomerase